MKNHRFSFEKVHIIDALLATQHARCHKEYYSPRGQAVSTSHFGAREQCQFLCKQSDFAFLEVLNPSEIDVFDENSTCETCHGCNPESHDQPQEFQTRRSRDP